MMRKVVIGKLILLILFYIGMIHMTGCWDNRDFEDKAIVSAVGLDKSGNKIELTVQIINPSAVQTAGNQGSGDEKATEQFSNTGYTVFEADKNLLTSLNRRAFYAHVEVIIIGEELAREGIMDVLDYFMRYPYTKRRAKIIIAKEATAKEILSRESLIDDILAIHISNVLENHIYLDHIRSIQLFDILKNINHPGYNPTMPVIEKKKKEGELTIKDMSVEGIGVFKKDKLIGWLEPSETRGLLIALDEIQEGVINVFNPLNIDKKIAIRIVRSSGNINIEFNDTEPIFLIDVKMQGTIADQQGRGDLTTSQIIHKIEKETEIIIENEIKQVVELAQKKYQSDIFGFGQLVHKKNLEYWNTVKDDWNETFSDIPVVINVEVKIKSSGLIIQKTTAE